MSTEDYISEFYTNDATPGGIFTPEKPMQATEYTAFLEEWEKRHRGVGQHHKANVTRVPGKWQATGISHQGTQMTDLLTYNVRDIARIYRVPAHYLMDPSITAYNSNVEEGKRLLRVTLDPWLIAIEKEANIKVPSTRQQGTYRCEFDRTQYTKGETTASDYRTLVESGILSRNEARQRMGFNPVAGGDEFLTPVNVSPAGESDGNEGAEPGLSDRFATNGKSHAPLR
jgi:HK97 family phage portal protein